MVLDPGGRRLDDAYARELAAGPPIVLLCGRYEGFDHRVHTHVATEALSIGPYVVSGGEIAAMVVIDAVVRQLDGALGDAESAEHESFSPALEGRIEHPHYTRPAVVPRLGRAGGAAVGRPRRRRSLAGGRIGAPHGSGRRSRTPSARVRRPPLPTGIESS